MKKLLLALAALFFITAGYAQKKNIQSASNSLKYKEYKEALEYIDLAVKDPSTQNDAKAWLVRGSIYLTMDQDPGYKDKGYYKEGIVSYKKVLELKPGYETEVVKSGLMYGAQQSYITAVHAYNDKKWNDAYEAAKTTIEVHDMDGGKLFAGLKIFDTIAAGAMVIQAYSAFYNEQPDKAIPILEQLKDNPIEGNANVYIIIADAYRKKGNEGKELAIIEEGRKKYPKSAELRNEELNYYTRTNQQDKLIQKFEDAVNSEPGNAMYQNILANAYTNMAFPKRQDGSPAPKPANYDMLVANAEKGLKTAISLDPENIGYHFDMGVLFFNETSYLSEAMNQVTGTTAEDDKKYNELKKERDSLSAIALTHFEKVYNAYDAKVNSLDADSKGVYKSTLIAMREIYARQSKLDKAAEIKKKYEAVN